MLKKKIALSVFAFSMLAPTAFAAETDTQWQERRQEHREMRAERKEDMQQRREERKEVRAEHRAAVAERVADRFAVRYKYLTTKLENVVARLKEKGSDTTAIEGMIGTLKEKIAEVKTASEAFDAALQGSDATARTAARTQLVAARDAVRVYYTDTLRPALVAAMLSTRTEEKQ